jgi:hypothetical protein
MVKVHLPIDGHTVMLQRNKMPHVTSLPQPKA